MKIKALRELNSEDLAQKELVLKKELFDLNYQRKIGSVEKPGRFRMIKRDIARILTILQERNSEKKKDGK